MKLIGILTLLLSFVAVLTVNLINGTGKCGGTFCKDDEQKFFEDLKGDHYAIHTDLNKTLDAILKNKEDVQKFFKDLKGDNDAIRTDLKKNSDDILKNKDIVKDIWKHLKDLEANFQKNCTQPADNISRKQGSKCIPKEYFMSTVYANFSEAFKNCEDKGMSLVSIESEVQYNDLNFYYKNANRYGDMFWSSGIRTDKASNFYWKSSGKLLSYTKWWPGYPYVNYNYHCIRFGPTNTNNLHMTNVDCSERTLYLCECRQ